MNFEPFYERCKSLGEKYKTDVAYVCNVAGGIFESGGYDDAYNIKQLFRSDTSKGSGTFFYRRHRVVIMFYEWLFDNGAVLQETVNYVKSMKPLDAILDEDLSRYYFRDIDECLRFVEVVCAQSGASLQSGAAIPMKSIVILLWHGVNLSDIPDIKKGDLDVERKTVEIHGKNTRTIQLNDEEVSVLSEMASRNRFGSMGSGYVMNYCSSPFLFRTPSSGQTNYNSLFHLVKKFNGLAGDRFRQEIRPPALIKNALFCKTLEGEKSGVKPDSFIRKELGCSPSTAFRYAQTYYWWRSMYVKEEE